MRFLPLTPSLALLGALACGGEPTPLADSEDAIAVDPGGGDPDPSGSAPKAPTNLTINPDRQANRLVLTWSDISSVETTVAVERRLEGGSFTSIRMTGPLSSSQTYNDTAVSADTRYCYRIRETNSYGSNYSNVVCAWTRPAVARSVWRLQLEVSVANVANGGTDDGLTVQLNDDTKASLPYGNKTNLESPANDFEPGSLQMYDLDTTGVSDLGDLTRIRLSKVGTDSICVSSIRLLANGVAVFARTFGTTASTCLMLDVGSANGTAFVIPRADIRASSLFINYLAPPRPGEISQGELEARITGLTGNAIAGTEVKWGPMYGLRYVEAEPDGLGNLRVDLDLHSDVFGPNPEVDVDLVLHFAFVPNGTGYNFRVTKVSSAVNVDSAWWFSALTVVLSPICSVVNYLETGGGPNTCTGALDDYITGRVEEALERMALPNGTVGSPCPGSLVPVASVEPPGRVQLLCQ